MAPTQKHLRFWVLCEEHEEGADPLTVFLPGFGEALAVFSFWEEALLYALLGGADDRRTMPVDAAALSALLLRPWSRFDRVALDPLPEYGAGLVNRLVSMERGKFLAFLASHASKARVACSARGRRR